MQTQGKQFPHNTSCYCSDTPEKYEKIPESQWTYQFKTNRKPQTGLSAVEISRTK